MTFGTTSTITSGCRHAFFIVYAVRNVNKGLHIDVVEHAQVKDIALHIFSFLASTRVGLIVLVILIHFPKDDCHVRSLVRCACSRSHFCEWKALFTITECFGPIK